MIQVLIVSPYASIRAALQSTLDGQEDLLLWGEASGSAELERLLPEASPQVVLADDWPGDRDNLLRLLANREAGLVLLGDTREAAMSLASALLSGWAWLRKEADGAEITGAIQAVASGLVVLDRSMTLWLTNNIQRNTEIGMDKPGEALTTREREVLGLMASGLPNKQIAARLSISLHTAKFHVASVLAKLGAASRTEAVTLGARRGLVSL